MGIEFWIVPVIAAPCLFSASLMRGKEEDRKGKVTKALAEFAADQPTSTAFWKNRVGGRQTGESKPVVQTPVARPVSRPRVQAPVAQQAQPQRQPPKLKPATPTRRAPKPAVVPVALPAAAPSWKPWR